jgi:hypothetical protein
MLLDEASLHGTVVSLCQALGNCIPGRDRDVPSCQVADVLCGPSFYLSTGDLWERRVYDLHSSRARLHNLWSCTSTRPICLYGLLFHNWFNLKSLPTQLLLSTPTLHFFFVIEWVVQQDPWIRVAWLKYVSQWGVWSALALCPPRCRHRYNKDDSASFSRKDAFLGRLKGVIRSQEPC